jgi:putative transposase
MVIPGLPHHVTQRGNNRQDVFFVDGDRVRYLDLLGEQCDREGVRLLGYCLMTNHVHLVAIPRQEDSLQRAVGRTHYLYAQYVNRLHGRSGHLWQGRFFSCALDEPHALEALRYVERNPVRAKVTRVPWTYRWSSAAAHTGAGGAMGLLDEEGWRELAGGLDWKEWLRTRDDASVLASLRLNTRTGRPLATDAFLSKLETLVGRRLRPLPVGRPKKPKKKPGK